MKKKEEKNNMTDPMGSIGLHSFDIMSVLIKLSFLTFNFYLKKNMIFYLLEKQIYWIFLQIKKNFFF